MRLMAQRPMRNLTGFATKRFGKLEGWKEKRLTANGKSGYNSSERTAKSLLCAAHGCYSFGGSL